MPEKIEEKAVSLKTHHIEGNYFLIMSVSISTFINIVFVFILIVNYINFDTFQ
jgi:hypothetical protein